jgi:BlaI family penicillinase repressor
MKGIAMARKRLPRPTDSELSILRVLWQLGPSTVREVYEVLNQTQQSGYTTILKFMQIMLEKGLVRRDDSRKTHIYESVLKEEETQRQLVGDLLQRAFGGSAQKLVLQALSSERTSAEELAEIRRFINRMEKKKEAKP